MAEDANGKTAGTVDEAVADGPLDQPDLDPALAAADGGEAREADPGQDDPAAAPREAANEASEGPTQADIDIAPATAADDDVAEPVPEPPQDTPVASTGRALGEAGAIEEEKPPGDSGTQASPEGRTLDLPDFTGNAGSGGLNQDIDLLRDVNLRVKIELGQTRMLVEDVLRLTRGSVVELDKLAGDPVDVFANDQLIAHGEVLVLNDNFCVRVSEIVSGGAASALKT